MEKQVEQWNLIELFGHSRIAGKVTVEDGEIRVDVPPVSGLQGFTKYFNKSAIYSRVVVDEETAVAVAANLKIQPVTVWSARQMLEAIPPVMPAIEDVEDNGDIEDDENENLWEQIEQ